MGITPPRPNQLGTTLGELLAWLRAAPPGTQLPATAVAERLVELGTAPPPAPAAAPAHPWRALLWEVDPHTRLGVAELAEAVGRPKSWIYRHTSKGGGCPRLPHRRMDGELVFVVGEIRDWLQAHEIVGHPGRTEPLVVERRRAGG